MKKNFKIVLYEPQMAGQVLSLLKLCLGKGATRKWDQPYWSWKHHQNPFGNSFGLIAFDDDESLAGVRVLMQWLLMHPDHKTPMKVARPVDTATHPKNRRQGLFSGLTKKMIQFSKESGYNAFFNTPNENSVSGYLKMGWKIVYQFEYSFKIKNYLLLLKMITADKKQPDSPDSIPFHCILNNEVRSLQDLDDSEISNVMTLINSHEKNRVSTGFRTQRSENYLRWRFIEHPYVKYAIVSEKKPNGELSAAALIRLNIRKGLKEIVISDLYAENADPYLLRLILKKVVKVTPADYFITSFSGNNHEHKELKKSGFYKFPGKVLNLVAYPLSPEFNCCLNDNSWDMSYGELELF